MIDIGIEKAVAYRAGGKITEEEMTLVLSALKAKSEHYGEVVIYQEIESFGGVEFDAIVEKVKFLSDIGITNIRKIALVTHKKWMSRIFDVKGIVFKKIVMKGFSLGEKNAATEFLKNA